MTGVLCPVLVGRDAEVGLLTAALEAATGGNGSLIFLTGEEGAGKSRLAAAACEEASARGFVVLTGRGSISAGPVPYRPLTEALIGAARRGVAPQMPDVSSYRRALGVLVPEWSMPGNASANISPVIVGEAVLRLLMPPGGHGGSLLVIEDLHLADPETLAVIEYLADNIGAASALCVLTARDSQPSPCAQLLHSLPARRAAVTVRVPRLRPAEVRQMAASCLGTREPPDAVSRLLSDCDGLPFAIEEVLAAAVASGELARDSTGSWQVRDEVATAVPGSIASSVLDRLALLGPAATAILSAAAVLGRQFDWELLPGIAGVSEDETMAVLRRACEVQLTEPGPDDSGAGTFRFRHSLTREAILASLMPPEIEVLARSSAAAIEKAHPGLPGVWCELTAELHGLAGQPLGAARLLVTSGRRALLRGAVSTALQVLDSAATLLTGSPAADPGLGIDIDEARLEGLAQAGDFKQLVPLARDLLTRLRASDAGSRREALIRLTVANTRPDEHPAAAADHLAVAAEIAGRLHDQELSARIDAAAARCAYADDNPQRAEELARRALAVAETAGLAGWAAQVALESLEVIGRRERIRDLKTAHRAFERSRQIADSTQLGIWPLRARHELATVEMLRTGTADPLRQVMQAADEAGAASISAMVSLQLANLLSLGSDLDQASDLARQAQQTAARIKAPKIQAFGAFLEANIAAIRGDSEAAEREALRAEAILPGNAALVHGTRGQSRVLAALFRDDITRAVQADTAAVSWTARAVASSTSEQRFYTALLAPRRTLTLHALLVAIGDGDVRAAIGRAREHHAATSWNAGCLAYAGAVQAGRDGDAPRAAALAEEGSAHFEPFAPWWNHLARRLVAPSAFRDQWGTPARWLREAAAGLDATGHQQLASSCRAILRRAGERVPRAGRGLSAVPPQQRRLGITSREMDVYLLVARGESTSAIAAQLHISPKTVETHIASLLAKTGMAGKRELVAYAARSRPA
jgi:DNA-binding CsgD family transcriptional regulator